MEASELHRVDDRRILRYDLTLPLLLTVRYEGDAAAPARRRQGLSPRAQSTRRTSRRSTRPRCSGSTSARGLDPWRVTGQVLRSVDAVLPGRTVQIVPTHYPMCSQAWELEVEDDGRWFEVMAWGVFTDRIVAHLGADPAVHTAIGVGYGLERLAMLRYGIDDIRKIEVARVA